MKIAGRYLPLGIVCFLGPALSPLLLAQAAPTILIQPTSQVTTAGSPVTFTVGASGTPSPTYQWRRNGVNILGATSFIFTIPNPRASDAGTYTVVVSNSSGSVTSNSVTLTVNPATPTIVWNPGPVFENTPLGPVQLNATVAGVPGTFVYNPPSGTLLSQPSANLSVTFTPTDTASFNPATTQRTVTVNPLPEVEGPSGLAAGQTATFTVAANGLQAPLTFQWLKNGIPIPGATQDTYTTPPLTVPADNGANFSVRITDARGISIVALQKQLTVFAGPQTITFNPPANPVVSPNPITLAATATSGLPVAFTLLSGPATLTGANLTLTGVGSVTIRASQAGDISFLPATDVQQTFTVNKGTPVITWTAPAAVADGTVLGATQLNAAANVPGSFAYNPPAGTVLRAPSQTVTATFTPADTTNYNNATAQQTITVNAPPPPPPPPPPPVDTARLSNLSVRTNLPAAQTLIVGLTMAGGSKQVLVRAVGPGLSQLGVGGVMTDPRLVLFSGTTPVGTNDNWGGGAGLSTAFASVGAFPLPAASLDAAMLSPIQGSHTVQITGPAGIVLVEAYDAGTGPSPRLTNISARNQVGTGDNILIAGFSISGTGNRNLLIRAAGPTLASLGVPGPLADPKLEVFSGTTKLVENDTWNPALAPTFSSVGAFPLLAGSRDAALTVTLPAGASYTVQVSGSDGGTGEAVVEIYELP